MSLNPVYIQPVNADGSWVWVKNTVTGAWGEAVVGTGDAIYIARKKSFYRYNPADNSWTPLTAPPNPDSGDAFKTGTALAWDFDDYIYALYGAATPDSRRWFYRYSISSDSWEALANTTADQGEGDAITWVGIDNCIYATIGGEEERPTYFVRYDPSTNSWSHAPADPLGMGDGASLVWTGGDFLYALRGEFYEESPLCDFWRYSLTDDVWTAMADIPAYAHDDGVGGVGDGGSLLYVGFWMLNQTDYIYALSGNQAYPEKPEIPDNRTYRYTISLNSWERLADLPFGVGRYVGCRLGYADGRIYAWQGTPSTWEGGGDDLAYYVFPAPEPEYILEISSTIGGTTDPAPGTYTYSVGTEVTVAATPEENYYFDHWELDAENAGSQNPIAITMDANHTLHAVFQEIEYTLTITTTSGGTTDPSPGEYSYSAGTQVPVLAIPDANNLLDYWELDGENAGTINPIEVLMNSNHTLHAIFKSLTYNLTISTTAGGTTDPTPGTYTYVNGTVVSITATPDINYKFEYWILNGANAGSDNPIDILMDSNHNLQAVFIQITYQLTIATTTGGTTNPEPGNYTYVNSTVVSVTAIPDANYVFDHWELDGGNIGSDNPIDILMDKNHTVLAVFALRTHTLTISSTAGGTTDLPAGSHSYIAGTTLNVTALPDSGFSFDYWLIDGEKRIENPITIVMDINHTLIPYFVDDIPPEIGGPTQEPLENVMACQNVTVTVNVTDLGTGVYNVTLWYSINNGTTWAPLNMTGISTNTYQATIPGYENCTWVTYKIIAYDNNGTQAVNDNHGYCYIYHIIPEFPSALILLLAMAFAMFAVIVAKEKTPKAYLKYRRKSASQSDK